MFLPQLPTAALIISDSQQRITEQKGEVPVELGDRHAYVFCTEGTKEHSASYLLNGRSLKPIGVFFGAARLAKLINVREKGLDKENNNILKATLTELQRSCVEMRKSSRKKNITARQTSELNDRVTRQKRHVWRKPGTAHHMTAPSQQRNMKAKLAVSSFRGLEAGTAAKSFPAKP